jgi:hypothetical protein
MTDSEETVTRLDSRNLRTESAAPPKQSELERFASLLIEQKELISQLDNRLTVVSNREPFDPASTPETPFHLSTLIDSVQTDNYGLLRLLTELIV